MFRLVEGGKEIGVLGARGEKQDSEAQNPQPPPRPVHNSNILRVIPMPKVTYRVDGGEFRP